MNTEKIFQYIQEHLATRLKEPYVSQAYTPEAKENLYAGIHIALLNADKELTEERIIDVFNAMNPEKRANMKFPTRKGSVAFVTEDKKVSEQGLLELLEWSENHKPGYGPRFELIDKDNSVEHFKTVKEMRDYFNQQSNKATAKILFTAIKNGTYCLRYIPLFDSINPFIDRVNLTQNEMFQLRGMQSILNNYEIFDAVQPKFRSLIVEFNKINTPSLVDIASFIKSMILLHPFPDGNGRTFMLGILNQVLLRNKLGICVNMDPRIALLSNEEIAQSIATNLIGLKQFGFEENNIQENQQKDVGDEAKISALLELSKSYILHLKEEILARKDLYSEGLEETLLSSDTEQYNHDPIFKLTLQKYQAVDGFCNILESEEKATDKLASFKQAFIENKGLLETRRDNLGITFLKSVLTLITIGVAALAFGIWNVKGQKFGVKIEEEISRPSLTY